MLTNRTRGNGMRSFSPVARRQRIRSGMRLDRTKGRQARFEVLEDRRLLAAGDILWTDQFGSLWEGESPDWAYAVDANGDAYVVGITDGIFGDESGGDLHGLDAFIRKYDASGNPLWTRQFGTHGQDHAISVAVYDSNIYVAGTTDGTLGDANLGGTDAFIRKYDPQGNVVGTTVQFGSPDLDRPWYIAVDATGVYVAGETMGSLDGYTNQGEFDAFVARFSHDLGTRHWIHQFGDTAVDQAWGLSVHDSFVYVSGRTKGDIDGSGPNATHLGNDDAFVARFRTDDPTAEPGRWLYQYGSSANDWVAGVSVYDTSVYVVGGTEDGLTADTDDALLLRLDHDGNEIWKRQFGTDGEDAAEYVSVSAAGVFIVGETSGAFPGFVNQGGNDAFVRCYSLDGNTPLWTDQFGSSEDDHAWGVSASGSEVYVSGSLRGANPGSGSVRSDAILRKYDAVNGTLSWTREFGSMGATSWESAYGTAVDDQGNVYVTGSMYHHVDSNTASVYVRKYNSVGAKIWERHFDTQSDNFRMGKPVAVVGDYVYVAAYTRDAFPGAAVLAQINASNGQVNWVDQVSMNQDYSTPTYATSVAVDATGVYLSGYIGNEYDGPLPGSLPGDHFVRKYPHSDPNAEDWVPPPVEWTGWFTKGNTDPPIWGTGHPWLRSDVFAANLDGQNLVYVTTGGYRPGSTIYVFDADTVSEDPVAPSRFQNLGTGRYTSAAVDGSDIYITDVVNYDHVLRKYSDNGVGITPSWTQLILVDSRAAEFIECVEGIAVNGDGVYVAGSTTVTVPGLASGQTSHGEIDAFVRAYDTDGNHVQTHQLGTPGWEYALDIAVDSTGVYLAGEIWGAWPGEFSAGMGDAFVLKMDHNTDPEITIDPTGHLSEDGVFTASGSFRDPVGGDWLVTVDFDDGTSATSDDVDGQVVLDPESRTFSVSHTYETGVPDTYYVTYEVKDNSDGGTATYDGQLIVVGDGAANSISIAYGSVVVIIDGETLGTYEDVRQLFVLAGDGDDIVRIDAAHDFPTEILGGSGDDTIEGGSGADTLIGGDGQDVLSGGDGEDVLDGGAGNDQLDGGDGADALIGGTGDDQLDGGDGDDALDGGEGNDQLAPGAGDDSTPEVDYDFQIVAPISLTPGSDAVRGQAVSFEATGEGSEVSWNFGDGTTDGNVETTSHTYADSGIYDVRLVVGPGESETTTILRQVSITAAALQPDCCDPTKKALVVGGTPLDDTINFNPGVAAGEVKVKVDGVLQGSFEPTGSIIAYGYDGNDTIDLAPAIDLPAWLYGGPGDDRLRGGGGPDVLLGQAGDDLLAGKDGRDILIGGLDADRIVGNADDDILVAGALAFLNLEEALCAIQAEWTSPDRNYMERVENLTNRQDDPALFDARANGSYFLIWGNQDGNTVLDDGASDRLTGSSGTDWFFFDEDGDNDRATDLSDEIFANDLDWINV